MIKYLFFLQVTALLKDAHGFPATVGSTANPHLAVTGDAIARRIVEEGCSAGRRSVKTVTIHPDGTVVRIVFIQSILVEICC